MSEHWWAARPLSIVAADGYPLRGFVWRGEGGAQAARPVVIVNPATSVRCHYYAFFADYLHRHGFDVVLYDYRGIGESRPSSLRRFNAGWIDWGRLDFEAVLRHVAADFPGQPIHVVAHSVGGFLIGLAPSNYLIRRVFTMGAQFAYWRDYAAGKRLRMFFKWHILMPTLTGIFGYFPGRRLGWLEDTPRGVVSDWTARHPRFEDAYRNGSRALPEAERRDLAERFGGLHGETLALSVSDDEFGTVAAITRLLDYFRNSPTIHLHVSPQAAGHQAIGHFAFFHKRFETSLWRIPLEWLQSGSLPKDTPGTVVESTEAHVAGTS
jgi:predicted alpha/beta hydrolase